MWYASPDCPISVVLDILAVNKEKPTIHQGVERAAKKYDWESEFFPFLNPHQIKKAIDKNIMIISIKAKDSILYQIYSETKLNIFFISNFLSFEIIR
ncbi:hypothetical protein KL86DYS1_31497 [uncultured Dysgonomonas sp.]|uniref:Uncharacterized protein n=1 Tax=uncultured Dysgonomonas sp. TaxID=206096 RepID=A0A212K5G2_9BACT|nr:hypothetical protein KL86DYS1_31497 [uncultured Dysgonomonas sp.]